ncbi:unnamed protein product [Cylicocyclus nassatus]|uniref:Uncharacterized protein n=1 Tax=Cylicocyclus nassatus TaxID=53992 RepID=A0AA36GPL8_CYLNA|nr:unnamed protein product [Cylicocyclus nassatus]
MKPLSKIFALTIALRYASSLNKEAKCHRPLMSKYVKYYLKSYLTKSEHTLLRHSCSAQTISDMDLKAGVYYRLAIFKICWQGYV